MIFCLIGIFTPDLCACVYTCDSRDSYTCLTDSMQMNVEFKMDDDVWESYLSQRVKSK